MAFQDIKVHDEVSNQKSFFMQSSGGTEENKYYKLNCIKPNNIEKKYYGYFIESIVEEVLEKL